MASCSSCGRDIADGAAFCGYCGAATAAPDADERSHDGPLAPASDYWVCRSCHTENLAEDAFCQSCGVARATTAGAFAAPPEAVDVAVLSPVGTPAGAAQGVSCTVCGTANEPDAAFCHHCGVPVTAKMAGQAAAPRGYAPTASVPGSSGGGRWIIIVAAIVAVAAAAVIGVVLLTGRGDDGGGQAVQAAAPAATAAGQTSGDASSSTTTTTTSASPTARNVTDYVASARASTCLSSDDGITYNAMNLVDGDMRTCWAEGVDGGYGIGETVRFKFSPRMTLTKMQVMPGYKKYADGWDRWYTNGRLREITVMFADGSQETYSFSDNDSWQTCDFGERVGSSLELTIDAVYRADSGSKHDADDTSVSEVRFFGWPTSEAGQ